MTTDRATSPLVWLAGLFAGGVALSLSDGVRPLVQTTINGLSFGAVIALGAVGLTLVYGILKLVNFAHGDYLTFGAYLAVLMNVTLGLPLVVAVGVAMLGTAALAALLEGALWRPMRRKRAGMLQLVLISIGLALLLRNGIQFVAGTEVHVLDVNRTDVVEVAGIRVGRTELIVFVVGVVVLVGVAAMLRLTLLGRRMRALSDNAALAETTGIDTGRITLITWIFAGVLAGLAGVLFASVANVKPDLGFELLLPIFAAVVLGGIGDALGALAAGLFLGVAIEWSTLLIEPGWKLAVGFLVLILALLVRPEGVFGKARTV